MNVATSSAQRARESVSVKRVFTAHETDPYAGVHFEKRTAKIANPDGSVVFQMDNVEIPSTWSKTAGDILVSKYFRKGGVPGGVIDAIANLNGGKSCGSSESSVVQVIDRIANAIVTAGLAQGYFKSDEDVETMRDELRYILVRQLAAFNSPVWFNVGLAKSYGIAGDPSGNWAVDEAGHASETKDGFSRPQASACFIRAVKDDLTEIGLGIAEEMRIFKYGSGAGANFSTLRGKGEKLSGGGTSSGVMSFLKVYDTAAGSVKSGGTTRRAAKLVCLDADHPDIEEFIGWKAHEEQKAIALGKAMNISLDFNGEAYQTVSGQNANNSVRATDEFMQAVIDDREWATKWRTNGKVAKTYKGRALMRKISEAAHACADPGMMYDTTINKWNTVPNTGRIDAANPCISGKMLVSTANGLIPIKDLVGKTVDLVLPDGIHQTTEVFATGERQVFLLRTKSGYTLEVTEEHPIWFVRDGCFSELPASQLQPGDKLKLIPGRFGPDRVDANTAFAIGYAIGNGCVSGEHLVQTAGNDHRELMAWLVDALNHRKKTLRDAGGDGRTTRPCTLQDVPTGVRVQTAMPEVVSQFQAFATLDQGSAKKNLKLPAFTLDRESSAALLRGLFSADGTVVCDGPSGKNAYVGLDSISLELIRQVQQLLLCFGIKAKVYENRRDGQTVASMPDGKGGMKDYPVQESHSLRITRSSRVLFEQMIGFHALSAKSEKLREMNETVGAYRDAMEDEFESLEPIGVMPTYDLREPITHHFVAGGIYIHNCNEFHFLNETACNLASINLIKFLKPDGTFDVPSFIHTCKVLILAMDILVDYASYPTKNFAENSHLLRPLGLGYANLGALLMQLGVPYDSDEGRSICASITSLMAGAAWNRSAEIAAAKEPFAFFGDNREAMLKVGRAHMDASPRVGGVSANIAGAAISEWSSALTKGTATGFRNAQLTLLAPTGTIGLLMDCDTTGIEPDFALVKYKSLAGGGAMKLVNQSIGSALTRLGYDKFSIAVIENHIKEHDTIEGAPQIKPEHLPVFDCANKNGKDGKRFLAPMGHLKMMAAAQQFLCGAISKCVTGDTILSTEKGLVRIGSLYQGEDEDSFRDIDIGVQSLVGRERAKSFYYGGVRPVIGVTLADGRQIKGTLPHRLRVATPTGLDWKTLPEIEPGDFVAVKLGAEMWGDRAEIEDAASPSYGSQKACGWPKHLTPWLATMIGMLTADGSVVRSNWTVTLTKNCPEVLGWFKKFVRDGFGVEPRDAVDQRNGVTSVVVSSKTFVEWLDAAGFSKEQAPDIILQGPRENAVGYLSGLYLDGYISQSVSISQKHRSILRDVQSLWDNLGVQTYFNSNVVNGVDYPVLHVSAGFRRKAAELLHWIEPHKRERAADLPDGADRRPFPMHRERLKEVLQSRGLTTKFRSVFDDRTQQLARETVIAAAKGALNLTDEEMGYTYVQVTNVEACGDEPVYDISVPATEAFVANGIMNHNTVNVPNEATVEEIEQLYIDAWKLGIKALAIYRDGSKGCQVLTTKKEEPKAEAKTAPAQTTRKRLPKRRPGYTQESKIGGRKVYLRTGEYPDGKLGEVFIDMDKPGSPNQALLKLFATVTSLGLQHGVPLEEYVEAVVFSKFEPAGQVQGDPHIKSSFSILDYIFRHLAVNYLGREDLAHTKPDLAKTDKYVLSPTNGNGNGPVSSAKPLSASFADLLGSETARESLKQILIDKPGAQVSLTSGESCSVCHNPTIRVATCAVCMTCGTTTGCG